MGRNQLEFCLAHSGIPGKQELRKALMVAIEKGVTENDTNLLSKSLDEGECRNPQVIDDVFRRYPCQWSPYSQSIRGQNLVN